MTVSNRMKLPEALVKAVSTERHNKAGEYSATTLLKDATEVILNNRHFDEIEVDAKRFNLADFRNGRSRYSRESERQHI